MIEEVKKILRDLEHTEYNKFGDKFIDAALDIEQVNNTAQQICQLFEPKPDEGRLLTGEEIHKVCFDGHEEEGDGWCYKCLTLTRDAQDAKTASIKDKEYKKEWLEYAWLVTELRNALAQKEGVK